MGEQNVILDEDLAPFLGITTKQLNQAVKRNIERFPEDWAFQLTPAQFKIVHTDKQSAGRGGRRSPPWAFTEHGVVMAASVLRSPAAIQAMQLVVEVFVVARKQGLTGHGRLLPAPRTFSVPDATLSTKLKTALGRMLESVDNHGVQARIRDEAASVLREAVDSIKERLKRSGAENEEIAARAAKLLAEAEAAKASAAKTRAETEQLEFETLVRKLRLLMSAELLLESGDVSSFVGVLENLGRE